MSFDFYSSVIKTLSSILFANIEKPLDRTKPSTYVTSVNRIMTGYDRKEPNGRSSLSFDKIASSNSLFLPSPINALVVPRIYRTAPCYSSKRVTMSNR